MKKDTLNNFIVKVYAIMGLGLLVSAFVSFLMLYIFPEKTIHLLNSYSILAVVGFGVLEVVIAIIFTLTRSYISSLIIYILFTVMNGITLSATLLFYTKSSIFSAFISTAILFFVMAVYGNVTKKDLSGITEISLMVLVGIIIAGIVNIFLGSGFISFVTSIASIVIFSIFTASDNQRIRNSYHRIRNKEDYNKAVINLAMNLYLDFLNLFLNNVNN